MTELVDSAGLAGGPMYSILFDSEFPLAFPMGDSQARLTRKIKSLLLGPRARQKERWRE